MASGTFRAIPALLPEAEASCVTHLTREKARMHISYGKAIAGGLAGTVVMTVVGVFLAPMMGMPKMNPADMLAGAMGGNAMLGWAGHLMIGTILALIYAAVAGSLPGAPWQRGALFALAPWLLAQIAVMPSTPAAIAFSANRMFTASAYTNRPTSCARFVSSEGSPIALTMMSAS